MKNDVQIVFSQIFPKRKFRFSFHFSCSLVPYIENLKQMFPSVKVLLNLIFLKVCKYISRKPFVLKQKILVFQPYIDFLKPGKNVK